MLPLGQSYSLTVTRVDSKGVWLDADGDDVLLPRREVAGELVAGDKVEAFLLSDKAGRHLASLQKPLAEVGEFALLQVKSVGPHGAFLDWGLEKDLLSPFSEQPQKMQQDRSYLYSSRVPTSIGPAHPAVG